jgi:hypothetical protein
MSDDTGTNDDTRSPWDRLEDPRVARSVGFLVFGLAVVTLVLADRPFELLYPLALVGAGLLLARRVPDSPLALAGCAGVGLGGVLEAVAVLGLARTELAAEAVALAGFVVFLVGRRRVVAGRVS